MQNKASLQSKPHFNALDGLRGVAAIAVVVFHFMEIAVPDYTQSFIAHAYLAVDFFFCLSGFVIAYAYDTRLKEIGGWQFFKLRLIRLHPLVVAGAVIGLLAFIFDPFSNLFLKYTDKTAAMFITSCLMVPYAIVPERYYNIFHLNPPTWSLFWEYIANIVYALLLVRVSKKWLWALVGIAAVALFYEAVRSGNLGVGWSGENITGGGIRVAFSFMAGLLIYRSGWIIRSSLGFVVPAILLFASFIVPFVNSLNWITDPLIIVFWFPFIIALAAGINLSAGLNKVCKFLGDLSYPLYMVHYPFIWIYMSWVELYKPSLGSMLWVMIGGTPALMLFAWLMLKMYDEPVRKYLKNRLKKGN